MSIKIIGNSDCGVCWSDPINTPYDYTILQTDYVRCSSDIKPETNQLRLIGKDYKLDHNKNANYFVLYTPKASAVDGLESYLHEIENTYIVECQLSSQVACDKVRGSYFGFWYIAKVNQVINIRDFAQLVEPEEFSFDTLYRSYCTYDGFFYERYQQWLYLSAELGMTDLGIRCLFYEYQDCLILVYSSDWGGGGSRSIITNYQLTSSERKKVYDLIKSS